MYCFICSMSRKRRIAPEHACVDVEEDVKYGGCLAYAFQKMGFFPPEYDLERVKKLFDDRISEVHVLFNEARRRLRKVCFFDVFLYVFYEWIVDK